MPEKKSEKKITDLVVCRKGLFVHRDSVEKYVAKYEAEKDLCQIPVRLESLDRTYRDFLEVQGEIERCDDPANLEQHLTERADFEARYCAAKGFMLSKCTADPNQSFHNISVAPHPHPPSASFHLRLPKIDLPKFNGDFSRWLSFRDTFTSMVHSNADIPTVAKLQYLVQSLEGEAHKPFESIDIEADNYAAVWETLLKRYDNRRFLKKQLFRTLHDLPAMKRESAQELHELADEFQRHVKALAKLDEPIEHWDTPLVNMLSYKLDPATLRAWEEKTSEQEELQYNELVDFLYQRVRILKSVASDLLQRSQSAQPKVAGNNFPQKKFYTTRTTSNAAASESRTDAPSCFVCSERHYLFQCPAFSKMSVCQRRELVTQRRLCWNCFRTGHHARRCGSKFTCRICRDRHHSLLHDSTQSTKSSTSAVTSKPQEPQPNPSALEHVGSQGPSTSNTQVSMTTQSYTRTVMLETVALHVVDEYGKVLQARALLDSGSMSNFMSKKLSKLLANRQSKVDIAVAGIGQSLKRLKRTITATIKSRTHFFSTKLEFLIIQDPTADLPTIPVDISSWELPKIELADPNFHIPGRIDIVIGSEAYWELHTGQKIPLGPGQPQVIETLLGWTISGPTPQDLSTTPLTCLLSTNDDCLEATLQKFWEIETIPTQATHSASERYCEKMYAETTTRDSSGRYTVRLPKVDEPEIALGDSRSIAERRFSSLERRLERDSSTKSAYHLFMAEYERLGHMKQINEPVDTIKPHCYLPHHPVFKLSSTTTKTRVVFDASCKTTSGFSLNNLLMVGPVVQQDLLSLVMRFRTHAVALVADIEKMYRQVRLHTEDQPLQRILWRSSPSEPIATYELQTVTYGTASAPYLATKTLQQLATDEGSRFTSAAEPVANDFYVDDFLSGATDVKTARRIRHEVSSMLSTAGFPLKKWASNSPDVLADIPPEDQAIQPFHDLQDEQSVSTLGLVWEPGSDNFHFKVQLPLPAAVLTKRKVMSYVAQIFDPLGLVGPTITKAKLFMQRLWALKCANDQRYEWDQPLPLKLQDEWREFHTTIDLLRQVRIPRYVSLVNAVHIELHFFADASEKAYGTCCYVRAESAEEVSVWLLASKSKVSPLSARHTIARLELCAAHLSTQLYKKVIHALKSSPSVYFWSDSTTVLQWIRSNPSRWKTFVANRVTQIQLATPVRSWKHIAGIDNPADDISRGLSPTEILNCQRWWNGPPWLIVQRESWPTGALPEEVCPEASKESRTVALVALTAVQTNFSETLFACYSSYFKLRRSTAYWLRYLKFLRHRASVRLTNPGSLEKVSTARKIGASQTLIIDDKPVDDTDEPAEEVTGAIQPLTTDELQAAERFLCRLAQRENFQEEQNDLVSGDRISRSSALKWLSPQLDRHGILRVGGRLSNASLNDAVKHPIILSAKHPLSVLLASYYHKALLHAGPQLMLASLRQKFWILGGRNLTRRIYHQCYTCFRNKPTLIQQSTADLPESRVTPTRPFSICGVDYCGPFYVKSPIRNRGPTKVYVAIFICFSTRAVHIELVGDLSTPAFIAALRRMVARRGHVLELHSDNGTAFRGAANALNRIYRMLKTEETDRNQIFNWCADNQIRWKFIPPRAPHFGGLWEAAVKSAKTHMLKEIGNTSLSYEDMLTLVAQVEMCLNSRPLTPIPSDASDLEALTPGHFLVGSSLQAVPERPVIDIADNRLDQWDKTQKHFQRIWARWYPEYIQQLQSRATKGCKTPIKIELGRIVVIKDDCLPPIRWPLGKIVKTHPGKDGVVRVVTLKTASAEEVVRPVVRIAFLPMPNEPQRSDTAIEDQ